MAFSHRDLRAHREVGRLAATVAGALLALIGLALFAPFPVLGELAVLGLGVVGGYAMLRGNALVHEYQSDRRSTVRDPHERLGALGVEVYSAVDLFPPAPSPTRRSPHARSPGRRRDPPDVRSRRPEPAS